MDQVELKREIKTYFELNENITYRNSWHISKAIALNNVRKEVLKTMILASVVRNQKKKISEPQKSKRSKILKIREEIDELGNRNQ